MHRESRARLATLRRRDLAAAVDRLRAAEAELDRSREARDGLLDRRSEIRHGLPGPPSGELPVPASRLAAGDLASGRLRADLERIGSDLGPAERRLMDAGRAVDEARGEVERAARALRAVEREPRGG